MNSFKFMLKLGDLFTKPLKKAKGFWDKFKKSVTKGSDDITKSVKKTDKGMSALKDSIDAISLASISSALSDLQDNKFVEEFTSSLDAAREIAKEGFIEPGRFKEIQKEIRQTTQELGVMTTSTASTSEAFVALAKDANVPQARLKEFAKLTTQMIELGVSSGAAANQAFILQDRLKLSEDASANFFLAQRKIAGQFAVNQQSLIDQTVALSKFKDSFDITGSEVLEKATALSAGLSDSFGEDSDFVQKLVESAATMNNEFAAVGLGSVKLKQILESSSPEEIIEQLGTALQGVPTETLSKTFEGIADQGQLALLQKNFKAIAANTKKASDVFGETRGGLDELHDQIVATSTVGDKFKNVIGGAISVLDDFTESVIGVSISDMTQTFIEAGPALLGFGSGLKFIGGQLKGTGLKTKLLSIGTALWGKITLLAGGTAATGFTIAQAPILPIVLAIGALVAIGVLLFKNWDKIAKFALSFFAPILDNLRDAWTNIKEAVAPLIEVFGDMFESTGEGVDILGILGTVLTTLIKVALFPLKITLFGISFVIKALTFVLKPLILAFIFINKLVIGVVLFAFGLLWDFLSAKFIPIWDAILFALEPVFDVFKAIGGFLMGAFVDTFDFVMGVVNRFITVWEFVKAALAEGIDFVVNTGPVDLFKSALNNLLIKPVNVLLNFDLPVIGSIGKRIGFPGGIPQLAGGGIIMPTPGGTFVNVGEGTSAEAVIPLDRPLPTIADFTPVVVVLQQILAATRANKPPPAQGGAKPTRNSNAQSVADFGGSSAAFSGG